MRYSTASRGRGASKIFIGRFDTKRTATLCNTCGGQQVRALVHEGRKGVCFEPEADGAQSRDGLQGADHLAAT